MVIWLTGLSGAGKTTIGVAVCRRLRERGLPTIFLDGDVMREMLGAQAAFTPDERRALAHTYGRICAEMARQGQIVVCSTISMFHSVRAWNRAHIPGYLEIYLRVPVEELQRRDPKGLYRRAPGGMVGAHTPFEEPETPDLIIDNHGSLDPDAATRLVLDLIDRKRSP